jgi:transposase
MARAYSEDLRARVVGAIKSGMSRRAAARKFEVSVSFAVKLMQRWQRSGTLKPVRIGGTKPYVLARHAELVQSLVRAKPDMTIDELRARLLAEGVVVGRSSIGRFLLARGLSFKKKRSRQRAGSAGRGAATGALEAVSRPARSGPPGLHR